MPSPLADLLDRRIRALGSDVRRDVRSASVVYRTRRQFARIADCDDGRVAIELRNIAGRLDDPEELTVPLGEFDRHRHRLLQVGRTTSIDVVMHLVAQAYRASHEKLPVRGDARSILRCSYPFPHQEPPVEASQACVHCPNADRSVLDRHAFIAADDPALVEALESFASWLIAEDEPKRDEVVRYAADLYTRGSHSGTCVPKTLLFAVYKMNQLASGYSMVNLTERGERAARGEPVESWPDGAVRSTRHPLFHIYGRDYL